MEQSEEKIMKEKVQKILKELTEEERKLLDRVIKAEREKLHMSKPRGINDEILQAVKEIIQ